MIFILQFIYIYLLFSVVGYIWEVFLYLIKTKRVINRGNFHGPWLSVYGFGGVITYYIISNISNNFIVLFIVSFIATAILEYSISYIEEVIWHNRWWDYSNKLLNVNGRICLLSLSFFGLFGAIASKYLINYLSISYSIKNIFLVFILFVIYLIDFGYTLYFPNVGKNISYM